MSLELKPSIHTLYVWWIRITIIFGCIGILSSLFLQIKSNLWYLTSAIWIICFLVLFVIYYPIKYKKLKLVINDSNIAICCGVIYTRVKIIPINNIQYINVVSCPLQSFFRISSVFILNAGPMIYFSGVPNTMVDTVKSSLLPRVSNR